MKKDLKIKLNPILEKFIDSLELEYDKVKAIQTDQLRELRKITIQQDELKCQKTENEAKLTLLKDKLEKEKLRQVDLNQQVKNEVFKYNKLCSEIEHNKKETEENLKDAKMQNQMISNIIDNTKKKANEYQALINTLKKDQANLENRLSEISTIENNNKRIERANNKVIEANSIKEMEFNEKDLMLRARESEVQRLIKLYKLEKVVKG